MKCTSLILFVVAASAAFLCDPALGDPIPVLGAAQQFAVLGHTAVTNTGPTVVFGSNLIHANVGNYGGENAISGFTPPPANKFFGPGTFTGTGGIVVAPSEIHGGDTSGPGNALLARNDLIDAWGALALLPATGDLTGVDLGTLNTSGAGALVPGVYSFSSSAQLTGTLQLNAGGIDGGVWVFQIGTDLTTASASAVQLINPGLTNHGSDVGVFWVLGTSNTGGLGSATLGTTTAFEGNILALTSITLNTGATILNGRALAIDGAVTLEANVISDICPTASQELSNGVTGPGSSSPNGGPGFSGVGFNEKGELVPIVPPPPAPIPEPSTMLLLGSGLAGLVAFRKRSKKA